MRWGGKDKGVEVWIEEGRGGRWVLRCGVEAEESSE